MLEELHRRFNVEFTIIIEGRAAKHLDRGSMKLNEIANNNGWELAMTTGFNRAYQLKKLWWANNVFRWEQYHEYIDIAIASAGFGGTCRYPYEPKLEEKNKRFIVKVIPRFSPNFFEVTNN
jgi:hypothetical protein